MNKSRLAFLFAIVCGLFAWFLTRNGLSITAKDSYAYFNAAKVIQVYGGLPQSYTTWTPLYPMLLSVFPNLVIGAQVLNIACFALSGFLTVYLLDLHDLGALFVLITIALSPAFVDIHQFAMSEPAFIVFTLLFFFGVKQLRQRRSVTLLAFATALACLQRYTGMMLIPAGIYAIWRTSKRPLFQTLYYVLLSATPIVLWMIRNLYLGAGLMGTRSTGTFSLGESIGYTAMTFETWLGLLIVLPLLAVFTSRDESVIARLLVETALFYTVLHIAFIILSAVLTELEPPNNRLLSPVYIPLLLIFWSWMQTHIRWRPRFTRHT